MSSTPLSSLTGLTGHYMSPDQRRSDKPTAVPIVAIFNWHHRGPSRQMSYARSDIATGDSALMHCLNHIGQTNYDARVTIPAYRGYWESNQFMTFSPPGPKITLGPTSLECLI